MEDYLRNHSSQDWVKRAKEGVGKTHPLHIPCSAEEDGLKEVLCFFFLMKKMVEVETEGARAEGRGLGVLGKLWKEDWVFPWSSILLG